MWLRIDVAERDGFHEAVRQDRLAVFAAPSLALGLATQRAEVTVDLILEARGRTFVGRGSAIRDGSIYAHGRRRALAVALDQALAAADETIVR